MNTCFFLNTSQVSHVRMEAILPPVWRQNRSHRQDHSVEILHRCLHLHLKINDRRNFGSLRIFSEKRHSLVSLRYLCLCNVFFSNLKIYLYASRFRRNLLRDRKRAQNVSIIYFIVNRTINVASQPRICGLATIQTLERQHYIKISKRNNYSNNSKPSKKNNKSNSFSNNHFSSSNSNNNCRQLLPISNQCSDWWVFFFFPSFRMRQKKIL